MLSGNYLKNIEIFSYITLIFGVLGDHISTTLALNRENIREANPMALHLMQQGIWIQADVLLVLVSILTTYLIIRSLKNPMAKLILALPSTAGICRLAVTLWNFSLIM